MPTVRAPLVLGDVPVSPGALATAARDRAVAVVLHTDVAGRLEHNAASARRTAEVDRVYGRTTGVGANRHVTADDSDGLHGRRLLRSHCAGAGPLLDHDVGRATLLVRINQLARARSGIRPDVVAALLRARELNLVPVVRRHGGVGTGDITVLAELGLSLLGERPWANGETVALLDDLDASAGLPLMSSSAPTLAVALLALADVRALVDAMLPVAAVGALGVRAQHEAWTEAAASARPHPGIVRATEVLRALIDPDDYEAARLQDPFGWRCLASVHGPLLDALAAAEAVLELDVNASAENPLHLDGRRVHHGGFHHGGLALELDRLRLALHQACALSLARLTKLQDPSMTGLRPFLAEGPSGSSGTMVLEYTAASALAELRQFAQPSTLGTTAISLGLEDHASFAWLGALALQDCLDAVRSVLSCELVAALRAARRRVALDTPLGPSSALRRLVDHCAQVPDDGEDHALVEDLATAGALLAQPWPVG